MYAILLLQEGVKTIMSNDYKLKRLIINLNILIENIFYQSENIFLC